MCCYNNMSISKTMKQVEVTTFIVWKKYITEKGQLYTDNEYVNSHFLCSLMCYIE